MIALQARHCGCQYRFLPGIILVENLFIEEKLHTLAIIRIEVVWTQEIYRSIELCIIELCLF